jgi:hypothetical protein
MERNLNRIGLDIHARQRLRGWPNLPPGLEGELGPGVWLKARPGVLDDIDYPTLKLPGANRMRTVPDALWLCFGGHERDLFVDIFVIEVCGTFTNLLDKRSRFAPSMHSMLATCPVPWLLGPSARDDETPRWQSIRLLAEPPPLPMVLPVRDIRVMYALPTKLFDSFASSQAPHAHEFFVPANALLTPDSWQEPSIRAMIARTSIRANFWSYNVAAE